MFKQRITNVVRAVACALLHDHDNEAASHPFEVHLSGQDMRGLPSPECICGGRMFYALVYFDDERNIGGYMLDGVCADCGCLVTLPTPIDLGVMTDD